MAAIPVVLNGVFTSDSGSVVGTFTGSLAYSDRGVGGGPVDPPSIWPSPGHPAHPIAPGGPPPSVWPNPPEGSGPHPEHPIYLPEPPTEPPEGPPDQYGFVKAPPPGGGWAYHTQYQWMYDAAEGVDPTPKG